MSNTYSLRRVLTVLAFLAVPAATCGVAPALHDLMLRTQRLERLAENAQLPPVLMDDHGIVIGRVLEYNDVMLFASVDIQDGYPVRSRVPWQRSGVRAFATVVFDIPGQSPVALEANRDGFYAPVQNASERYYYESTDCSGTAWVQSRRVPEQEASLFGQARITEPGHTLYVADLDAPPQRVHMGSYQEVSPQFWANYDYPCHPWGYAIWGLPLRPVYDLDAFTPPFQIADQRELWLQ